MNQRPVAPITRNGVWAKVPMRTKGLTDQRQRRNRRIAVGNDVDRARVIDRHRHRPTLVDLGSLFACAGVTHRGHTARTGAAGREDAAERLKRQPNDRARRTRYETARSSGGRGSRNDGSRHRATHRQRTLRRDGASSAACSAARLPGRWSAAPAPTPGRSRPPSRPGSGKRQPEPSWRSSSTSSCSISPR